MDVLSLMNSKNRVLDRLLQETEDFLKSHPDSKSDIELYKIEKLQKKRSHYFRLLELHDEKIIDWIEQSKGSSKTEDRSHYSTFRELTQISRSKLLELQGIDQILFGLIEEQALRVKEEAKSAVKSKDFLHSFRNSSKHSRGGSLDETI